MTLRPWQWSPGQRRRSRGRGHSSPAGWRRKLPPAERNTAIYLILKLHAAMVTDPAEASTCMLLHGNTETYIEWSMTHKMIIIIFTYCYSCDRQTPHNRSHDNTILHTFLYIAHLIKTTAVFSKWVTTIGVLRFRIMHYHMMERAYNCIKFSHCFPFLEEYNRLQTMSLGQWVCA